MTTWSEEDLSSISTSWSSESLPSSALIPLYAQDGTPLVDQNGNQLYAQGYGTSWTDEVLP